MALIVKGWHGKLSPNFAKKMDGIAIPIQKDYEWEFEGSVGDFADQWQDKFMALMAFCPSPGDKVDYDIYITQFSNFGQR